MSNISNCVPSEVVIAEPLLSIMSFRKSGTLCSAKQGKLVRSQANRSSFPACLSNRRGLLCSCQRLRRQAWDKRVVGWLTTLPQSSKLRAYEASEVKRSRARSSKHGVVDEAGPDQDRLYSTEEESAVLPSRLMQDWDEVVKKWPRNSRKKGWHLLAPKAEWNGSGQGHSQLPHGELLCPLPAFDECGRISSLDKTRVIRRSAHPSSLPPLTGGQHLSKFLCGTRQV